MALQLENVVPWGRSAREYFAMFMLTEAAQRGRILDCGGGPSSFTAEATHAGARAVACDPLYQFSQEAIRERIAEVFPKMMALNESYRDRFRWEDYGSPRQLGDVRMEAMRLFLEDYPVGRKEGRYIVGELPELPFASESFDFALCSHFLFTYSDLFPAEFHLDAVLEMVRVAQEARIFPLLTAFSGERSPHLSFVMEALRERGYRVEVRRVAYEFQIGGNEMLSVSTCQED